MNMCVTGCHQRNSVLRGKAMAKVSFMKAGFTSVARNMITFR